ncbi:hypothetical protein COT42_03540 [Candidatus Saganbacteria bacterium CG08_land_8_20_14_0_20_45_16]|uniref:Uncharacterized protein n=1 Tax=Candidatus Saganbacteria bacterium CG08_land_8_20_14_0_20_45_16 TaxID=2014293 RepID=A0A2H0XYY3_UNCSA|nr:MAG: hypothetical protein COT42_03540 [Candidatus Saganbacteria bacterium CG08_land_8_20_14_0_20_45_16]
MFDGMGAVRALKHNWTNPLKVLGQRSRACQSFFGAISLPQLNPSWQNEAQLVERKIIARYGCYEANHEVTNYAKALLRRVAGDNHPCKIMVTKYDDQLNAIVLPSGTIIISDRFFALCEYEEEILFVLGHELEHLRQGHFQHLIEEGVSNHFARLALKRQQEWFADLAAFVNVAEERGINPYGGKVLLARMNQFVKQGKDIVHGSLTERSLNMEMLAHEIDLTTLSTKLTRVLAQFKQLVPANSEQEQGNYRKLTSPLALAERLAAAKKADLFETVEALADLNAKFEETKEYKTSKPLSQDDYLVIEALVNAFENKFFKRCGEKYTNREKMFMMIAVLFLEMGVDTFRLRDGADPFHALLAKISAQFLGPADYWAMMDNCDPAALSEMGFVCAFNQTLFAKALVGHALRSKALAEVGFISSYFDFLQTFREKARVLLGSFPYFDWILMGLAYIDTTIELATYFTEAEKTFGDHISVDFLRSRRNKIELALVERLQALLLKRSSGKTSKEPFYQQCREEMEGFSSKSREEAALGRVRFLARQYLAGIRSLPWLEQLSTLTSLMDHLIAEGEMFDYFDCEAFVTCLFGYLFEELMQEDANLTPFNKLITILRSDSRLLSESWWRADYGELGFDDLALVTSIFYNEQRDARLVRFSGCNEQLFFAFLLCHLKELMPNCNQASFIKEFMVLVSIMDASKNQFFNQRISSRTFPEKWQRNNWDFGLFTAQFLHALFSNYQFDLADSSEVDFLYEVSYLFADGRLAMKLREKLTGLMDYTEKKKVLIEDARFFFSSSLAAKEEFVDYEVYSIDHLEEIEAMAKQRLEETMRSPSMGGWLVGEDVFEMMQREIKLDSHSLFKRLMETDRDDSRLRSDLLFARLWKWHNFRRAVNTATIAAGMHLTDNDLAGLYQLGRVGKHGLVRFLLVGENGLLQKREDRVWLLNYIFKRFVKKLPGRASLLLVLKRVLPKLAELADLETLFFFIGPFIEKRILRSPEKISGWEKTFKREGWVVRNAFLHNFWLDLKEKWGRLKGRLLGRVRERSTVWAKVQERKIKSELNCYPGALPDIMALYQGSATEESTEAHLTIARLRSLYEPRVFDLIGPQAREQGESSVDPMKVVLECASPLWSLGTRFLQVLGQSVKLAPADEEELSSAYDDMHGQSKWASLRVLKREWVNFKEEVLDFGWPIGGGSLMRVYKIKTRAHGDEAVKVLNPNAEYFLEKTYELLSRVAEALTAKYGRGYRIAGQLLREINEWISRDINFAGFLAKDKVFYQHNQGWRPASFRYSIRVPKSYGVDNKYYKREEYLDGLNLTKMKKLRLQGHDLKQIVALLVQNYYYQVEKGLIHSDAHIGNFNVVAESDSLPNDEQQFEVAILDRNLFLEPPEEEQQLFLQILRIVRGQRVNQAKLASALCSYLSIDLPSEQHALAKRIKKLAWKKGPAVDFIKSIMVFVKKENIVVPFSLTLLIKNLNAFQRMGRKAGFKDLSQALLYVP